MPPTKGHMRLIEFAAALGTTAEVIVCTQPCEPYSFERLDALRQATKNMNVNIHHIHKELPQEPEGHEGFWDMWKDFLLTYGLQPEDYIVASEMYGAKLAEITGAKFYPYDVDRSLYLSRATWVREDSLHNFDQILPEFQPNLRRTVTIFGAESTGKTTLSRILSTSMQGHWLFEWARPFLEKCRNEITTESMTQIWHGQAALQRHARDFKDKAFIFQDTDLFSTVGYWDFWDMNTPDGLVNEAIELKSDLYLITQSNIPFEQDPLRYGGDRRESQDQYWIDLCDKYGLNYKVLTSDTRNGRLYEATNIIRDFYYESTSLIDYVREGN